MNLEVMYKMAQGLWKPGMPKKAAEYLYDKIKTIIQDEKLDREEFRRSLENWSDDELMAYVPDVYQEDIYRIDYGRLKEKGVQLISFDIDDTIDDSFINKLEANAPMLTVAMPDKAKELVRGLKDMGFRVVLLTNAQQELAEGACKDLGADDYIARAKKPETGGFETIASRYGLDKSQMAHVGNSMRADIAGGNRYGVTTCLVRRAGISLKLVKFAMKIVGLPTKGHLIREKLLQRDIWRKHHSFSTGDQYYQLGEKPEYRGKSRPSDRPVFTVFCDGKSPYTAAFNICGHIQSLGYEARIKNVDDYYDGYPGKVIIIGHHDFTKKHMAEADVCTNSLGLMIGFNRDKCVLRASRSALGRGKKGRKEFEAHYNFILLHPQYKELAARYNVPLEFGSRDETRKSQYDLLWLIFAMRWLSGFLGETDGLGAETDTDIAVQAAKDLVQKFDADREQVFDADELLRNAYKEKNSAAIKTLEAHLGNDIILTGTWDGMQGMRELEENELLDGEMSAFVFQAGSYMIRQAVCLYQDGDGIYYTDRKPAGKDAIAAYKEYDTDYRKVCEISAKHIGGDHNFSDGWQHVCLADIFLSWSEEIHFICTVKRAEASQDSHEALFVLKEYTGSAFSVDHWYRLTPDGTVKEYVIHPLDQCH